MATVSKVEPLVDALRARILAGEFDGGRLPSFRQLSSEYNTTQETMNKVMQALQAEGLLVSQGTKGVFVNNTRVKLQGIIPNFYKFIKEYGQTQGFDAEEKRIMPLEVITPSELIAKSMRLSKNTKVLKRVRTQGSTQLPFRIDTSYYPMTLINEDMLKSIQSDDHFHIVSAIKEHFKKVITNVHEEIHIRLPNASEQKYLQIVRTNPVIDMNLVAYTEDKKIIIMYCNIIFNANLFFLNYDHSVDYWSK